MTTEDMAQRILKFIREMPGATFVELVEACGDEAKGIQKIHLGDRPNSILWINVSDKFCAAFNLVKPQIDARESSSLVYAMDGGLLTIPLPTKRECKQLMKSGGDFPEERWLPVALTLKKVLTAAV